MFPLGYFYKRADENTCAGLFIIELSSYALENNFGQTDCLNSNKCVIEGRNQGTAEPSCKRAELAIIGWPV